MSSLLDPADARSLADVTRGFIEARSGVRLPDLRPEHSADTRAGLSADPEEGQPEETAPGPTTVGTYSYPSPAGDLTGDGLADMVVFDMNTETEDVTIRALRGTNGHLLWSVDLDDTADAVGYPVGDLTGDGKEDLLIHELTISDESTTEDCEGESLCLYEYSANFDWTVGIRSGKDGRRTWSWRYPGSMSYRYRTEETEDTVTSGNSYEESLSSENLDVLPYVSGDHDGDDLADIVIQAIDLDWSVTDETRTTATLLEQRVGGSQLSSQTRAQVLSGASGNQFLHRASATGPRVALMEPIGDVVGDSAPDLLWEESITPDDTYSCTTIANEVDECTDEAVHTFTLELEVIDGSTLSSGWRKAISGVVDGFSWPTGEDLTGDGAEDILVFAQTDHGRPFELRLLSGPDGLTYWTRPQAEGADGFESPLAVGHLDGQVGADLVLGTFLSPTGDPFGVPNSARISRVNGATGQTLFETEHQLASLQEEHTNTFDFLYLAGMGDSDGDGSPDAVVGSVAIGYERAPDSQDAIVNEVSSNAVVVSGRSPASVYNKEADEPFTLEPAADLTGDGAIEAFEFHNPVEPGQSYRLSAVELATGSMLWNWSLSEDEYSYGTLWPGGDHDGKNGDDIVYGRNDLTAAPSGNLPKEWNSLVASLDGATAAERWRSET